MAVNISGIEDGYAEGYKEGQIAKIKQAESDQHKADVAWLIERIIHDDRGYVFNMTDKEWQEFIK